MNNNVNNRRLKLRVAKLEDQFIDEELTTCFKLFDQKNTGAISVQELVVAASALGCAVDAGEIRDIRDANDPDEPIPFEIFRELMRKHMKSRSYETEALLAFRLMDTRRCGKLKHWDIAKAARDTGYELSDQDIEKMIAMANDGNGSSTEVTEDQFLRIMRKANNMKNPLSPFSDLQQ